MLTSLLYKNLIILYKDYENRISENKFQIFDLDKIDIESLPELEKFMLSKIYSLNNKFENYFKKYDFHNLYKELLNFCTTDLSAFYFDI